MSRASDPQGRNQIKAAMEESLVAAREVTKDAVQLSRQAVLLRKRAAQTRAQAQELRAPTKQEQTLPAPSSPLLTIPEAARHLHVCERTLRRALTEPALQARLIERTHKAGIYYKFLPLLTPDLTADLAARFASKEFTSKEFTSKETAPQEPLEPLPDLER